MPGLGTAIKEGVDVFQGRVKSLAQHHEFHPGIEQSVLTPVVEVQELMALLNSVTGAARASTDGGFANRMVGREGHSRLLQS